VAVLVPAHNESVNVLPTLACLQAQLGSADRLVVVADNCSDDTAALARAAGAEVIERQHNTLRGKGYALAFGVDHLRADPPDVVLVVDADCTVSDGGVDCIAQRCHATVKPVQMLNLMQAPPNAGLKIRVLEFAMLMKNLVRPLGSYRLGRACHLMGTGMALPWSLMSTAQLATGHITEDMKLGIDLAIAGQAPIFLPQVRVSSAFPTDSGVARVQKSRWEHGHLATLAEELPPLLAATLRSFKPALVVLSLDLLIPPVALYFLVLASSLLLVVGAALIWPVWLAAAGVVCAAVLMFALAIGLGWWFFGRQLLSARELFTTPLYALWKLPVYVAYFLKKRSGWVRTKRDSE
jgi:cellulose synthase/poly-beta-1,6-N-acetylglucosamine synthase-like glycosyltransferase